MTQEVIVALAVVIIAVLFYFQSHGTAQVGGAVRLDHAVLVRQHRAARDPRHRAASGDPAVVQPDVRRRVLRRPSAARRSSCLGAVVLVVTGGEALYADMGHFGPRPIRVVWFWLVLPALLLNYFGQGALLLARSDGGRQSVLLLAPSAFLYPMLVIATLAAIVASQALISGAFSLTQQAVQLGYSRA